MTKEKIIIDGVDVAGCRFLKPTLQCEIQQVFQRSEIVGIIEKPYGAHLECELSNPDCYYKQLQRIKERMDSFEELAGELQERNHYLTQRNEQLTKDLTALQQTYEACKKRI